MSGLPGIPFSIKCAALQNLETHKKTQSLKGNDRKVATPNGEVWSVDDMIREINLESDHGFKLAQIWSRPESEILAEIKHAQDIVHSSSA